MWLNLIIYGKTKLKCPKPSNISNCVDSDSKDDLERLFFLKTNFELRINPYLIFLRDNEKTDDVWLHFTILTRVFFFTIVFLHCGVVIFLLNRSSNIILHLSVLMAFLLVYVLFIQTLKKHITSIFEFTNTHI